MDIIVCIKRDGEKHHLFILLKSNSSIIYNIRKESIEKDNRHHSTHSTMIWYNRIAYIYWII